MYGLPQAGIIAQELLADRLQTHGYTQNKIIPGFWTHSTRPICFILVVDDFAIKYTRRFKHEIPHKKQNSPHPHVIPNYGAKAQFAEPEEDLPILGTEEIKFIKTSPSLEQKR